MINRILMLMKDKGVTATKLTSDLEFSNSSITDWKKGKAKPSTDAIIKLASYFNVTTDWLLTGKGDPRPTTNEPTLTPNPAPLLSLSETEEMLIAAFRNSNKTGRYMIINKTMEISNREPVNKQQQIQNNEQMITTTEAIEDEPWIEEKVEAYSQELRLQENLKMSSAS